MFLHEAIPIIIFKFLTVRKNKVLILENLIVCYSEEGLLYTESSVKSCGLYQDPYQLFFELTTKNATVRYASS
jgi:uncharacterized protein (DUF885 family)